jgi:type IV pilus assembly protein PilA
MNANFKAKFLQNLVSKKKGNEGFTLIELLVVIIIVGVLAAIALPSFLNQIGKARGSEAKANLGVINRGQQAYRLERNTFSTNLGGLDARVTGKFYSYSVGASDAATASALAGTSANGNELKPASSLVNQTGDVFTQIICESTTTAAANAAATAPATTTLPTPAAPQGGCAGGYVGIQ